MVIYSKKTKLIQPIQDKVFDAITENTQMRPPSFIFDKASEILAKYFTPIRSMM